MKDFAPELGQIRFASCNRKITPDEFVKMFDKCLEAVRKEEK